MRSRSKPSRSRGGGADTRFWGGAAGGAAGSSRRRFLPRIECGGALYMRGTSCPSTTGFVWRRRWTSCGIKKGAQTLQSLGEYFKSRGDRRTARIEEAGSRLSSASLAYVCSLGGPYARQKGRANPACCFCLLVTYRPLAGISDPNLLQQPRSIQATVLITNKTTGLSRGARATARAYA